MTTLKRNTSYKDKSGFFIHEGDLCRSWRIDNCDRVNGGAWLYERIKLFNGKWCLFEVGFDYDTNEDEPHLLERHHLELEIVSENICKL